MLTMTKSFENKVALVVGASSGIGRATALGLASAGAKVVVAARRQIEGQAVVEQIQAAGGEAAFEACDVSVPADIEGLVAKTVARYGRLDCAVNNAGLPGDYAPLADVDDALVDMLLSVNVKGVYLCMKHEIRQMLKQGAGSIVNTSSFVGMVASPTGAMYAATKHAVIGMTRGAALAYAKQGIRINTVCPTIIGDTDMVAGVLKTHAHLMDPLIAQIPMGRLGRSEEVANAILWLLSDSASLVTGHALAVDGGHVAQ